MFLILREMMLLYFTCRTQYDRELRTIHKNGNLTTMDVQMKVWMENR